MAEGSYESECMRAELLGVAKPDYEEFVQRQREEAAANPQTEPVDSEEVAKDLSEAPVQDEQEDKATASSSTLEELNNMISPVISITQKKIDSFKIRCGSVSDMIKTKIGSISGASGSPADATDGAETEITDDNSSNIQ